MISIERCRQLLGPDCDLSDEEIEALRDQAYTLANIAIKGLLGNEGSRGEQIQEKVIRKEGFKLAPANEASV
jgi:hypothetical protein